MSTPSTTSAADMVFPSKQEYMAQQKLKKQQSIKTGKRKTRKTGSSPVREESNDSVLGAEVMDDILGDLDDLDMDFEDDGGSSKKGGNKQKIENGKVSDNKSNDLIDNLDLDFDDEDYDEDNTAALKREQV